LLLLVVAGGQDRHLIVGGDILHLDMLDTGIDPLAGQDAFAQVPTDSGVADMLDTVVAGGIDAVNEDLRPARALPISLELDQEADREFETAIDDHFSGTLALAQPLSLQGVMGVPVPIVVAGLLGCPG
jgi:hypothetical protein